MNIQSLLNNNNYKANINFLIDDSNDNHLSLQFKQSCLQAQQSELSSSSVSLKRKTFDEAKKAEYSSKMRKVSQTVDQVRQETINSTSSSSVLQEALRLKPQIQQSFKFIHSTNELRKKQCAQSLDSTSFRTNYVEIKNGKQQKQTRLNVIGGITAEGTLNLNNQLQGAGRLIFKNGDMFVGHLKDGKMHGFGTILFADGKRFEGQFVDGKRHGYGKFIISNRIVQEGEFINDKLSTH